MPTFLVQPDGRPRPLAIGHETAIYVLEGRAVLWFGEGLESRVDVGPGDFLYIPLVLPHILANASNTEWAWGVRGPDRPQRARERGASLTWMALPHLVL